LEKLNPTYSSTKPAPRIKEAKTIIIASIDEKPMYLKALVSIKYAKYKARIGRRIYSRYKPILAKPDKANIIIKPLIQILFINLRHISVANSDTIWTHF